MDFVVRAFLYFEALWSYDKYQFAEAWKQVIKFTGKGFACIILEYICCAQTILQVEISAAIFNFDLLRFIEEISINIISRKKHIERALALYLK